VNPTADQLDAQPGAPTPGADPRAIATALRQGMPVSDETFDALYPAPQQRRSLVHWTPIEVALRASAMLAAAPGGRILDVGSGTGKMCIIGALTSGAYWAGVEQDVAMVRVAQRVARSLEVEAQTGFVHANGLRLDWSSFGGLYLYNPFSEAVFDATEEDRMRREDAYIDAILEVEEKLATLQIDARVVTLHGFGGDMPAGFELAESVPIHDDELCLWIRRR